MNNQQNAFFFEIQQIPDPENSIIFDEFKKQELFFSYFQVDQKYYLFFYRQKFIDIDSIDQFIPIIKELDRKQRKLRSLRGFFLYASESMENGKDLEILRTNLQSSFWRKLKTILRQNKKAVLLQFLFGSQDGKLGSTPQTHLTKELEEKIQIFENQIASLQERVIHLESQTNYLKNALSEPFQPLESSKTTHQGDSTLEGKKGPYLTENQSQIRNPTSRTKDIESKSLSEAPRSPFKPLSDSQQYHPIIQSRESA